MGVPEILSEGLHDAVKKHFHNKIKKLFDSLILVLQMQEIPVGIIYITKTWWSSS